ncbi:MAG: hypothetical protein C0476_05520, partial [Sphingomonas sp.]|nr:hypothetical protein [Sphingomonas sp.]
VSLNTNLPAGADFSFKRVTPPAPVTEIIPLDSPGARTTLSDHKAAAKQMRAMLKAQDMSLEDIEALADSPP